MPSPVETRRNSMHRTVVINALCGCYSRCYFTFTGAASLVCGSGVVLVPEVLNNIQVASNALKLCSATKWWCRYMVALMYTVLKTNIINKLKLYGVRFVQQGRRIRRTAWPRRRVTASNQCGIANQENHLRTLSVRLQELDRLLGQKQALLKRVWAVLCMCTATKM